MKIMARKSELFGCAAVVATLKQDLTSECVYHVSVCAYALFCVLESSFRAKFL